MRNNIQYTSFWLFSYSLMVNRGRFYSNFAQTHSTLRQVSSSCPYKPNRLPWRHTEFVNGHRQGPKTVNGRRQGPQTVNGVHIRITVNGRRQGPQTANMIHGQPDCRSATTCSQQTATRPTGRWLQGPEPISIKIPWSCVHYRHIAKTLWPTHTYSKVLIMNAPAENYPWTPEWICVCVSIYIHFC